MRGTGYELRVTGYGVRGDISDERWMIVMGQLALNEVEAGRISLALTFDTEMTRNCFYKYYTTLLRLDLVTRTAYPVPRISF